MLYRILFVFLVILTASCTTTRYYVVRHAEKEEATMSRDVELSEKGKQRAAALPAALEGARIDEIYSTPYIRTRSTVDPLAKARNLQLKTYQPMDTAFFRLLRTSNKNTLIAGHSNTVDDIVNQLLGTKIISADLPESQYGDLFIIKRKGKKYSFERKNF